MSGTTYRITTRHGRMRRSLTAVAPLLALAVTCVAAIRVRERAELGDCIERQPVVRHQISAYVSSVEVDCFDKAGRPWRAPTTVDRYLMVEP